MQFHASAKINLALHVTGQREDGYHLLDSLVTFADFGDELLLDLSSHRSLTIDGPYAQQLHATPDNLVWRAASLLSQQFDIPRDLGFSCQLTKRLPVASGIGGGSADAAAMLLGLCQIWKINPDQLDLPKLALTLGADVPMCLTGESLRARGIGDDICTVQMPKFHMVLANPNVGVSTPQVFKTLKSKNNPALTDPPSNGDHSRWVSYLLDMRNDLQEPAIKQFPVIADCISALETQPGCLFARMSGSGATCFALFDTVTASQNAAHSLKQAHNDWWVVGTQNRT